MDPAQLDESLPLLVQVTKSPRHRGLHGGCGVPGTPCGRNETQSRVLPSQGGGLTFLFATLCIIDLFGVFPIVALPRAIINCGTYVYS
jgi:hypothetical protein